jgi:transcriptional antiterminator RfaH
MDSGWYVLRTKTRNEARAAASLEREGLDHYFPRVRLPRPPAGSVTRPLFPGYLFVRHEAGLEEWPSIRDLPGVMGWLRLGGTVPLVPDEVISELVERVDSMNSADGLWTQFRPGERVLVVSGKMESLAEVLEEPKSPEARVRVLLDFMGRQVSALVPWHNLRQVRGDAADGATGRRRRRTRGGGRWVRGFGPRAASA